MVAFFKNPAVGLDSVTVGLDKDLHHCDAIAELVFPQSTRLTAYDVTGNPLKLSGGWPPDSWRLTCPIYGVSLSENYPDARFMDALRNAFLVSNVDRGELVSFVVCTTQNATSILEGLFGNSTSLEFLRDYYTRFRAIDVRGTVSYSVGQLNESIVSSVDNLEAVNQWSVNIGNICGAPYVWNDFDTCFEALCEAVKVADRIRLLYDPSGQQVSDCCEIQQFLEEIDVGWEREFEHLVRWPGRLIVLPGARDESSYRCVEP